MKISLDWLSTLIDHQLTADELSALLTDAGLEVEGRETIEAVRGGLKGLVVGEVIECAKHPGADRLSVTRVNVGNGESLPIVCGAPNVAVGQKVIVAVPGTKLFPVKGEPFEIKKSKIRGEVSEGMICAEDEIGVGENHDGIIVLPEDTEIGKSAAEVFNLRSDEVLEIGLTPNRGDAASHYGVARDLAALLNAKNHTDTFIVVLPGDEPLPAPLSELPFTVEIQDAAGCPRYCGIEIRGTRVGDSPAWLQDRLRSIGIRPVNNIVDITNFVMHELGQPLHGFDADQIEGKRIVVRRAAPGEKMVTLDGVERSLHVDDLMICDELAPMCIAGVFGGSSSGVSEKTQNIFLESAYFDPSSVRRSARRHGLRTDASFRFERGTDPEMTVRALIRAAQLVLEIAGGKIAAPITDVYPEKLIPYKVAFSYRNCNDLVGKELDRAVMKSIILNLGMEIESEGSDGLLLHVPRYKHDVTREADVIEEVLRVYGYDHVEPSKKVSYGIPAAAGRNEHIFAENIAQLLTADGFSEMMTLSLTNSTFYNDGDPLVKVLNPLSSELDVLRANLIFGGLETIAYNVNRQSHDLRFFELGRVYSAGANNKYTEKRQLAIFASGSLFGANAHGFSNEDGFALIKSAVSAVFAVSGVSAARMMECTDPHFAYCVDYKLGNRTLAVAGQVDAKLARKFGLSQPVYYACLEWDELLKASAGQNVVYREIPKFPAVKRDLALLLDKSVSYGQVEELAFRSEKKLLAEVNLFDIYVDPKLEGKKSYAVRFTLQDPGSTLTEKQIDSVMTKLITTYREKLGAELR